MTELEKKGSLLKSGREMIKGSQKRHYQTVFIWTVILYLGYGMLGATWYLINHNFWWGALATAGLSVVMFYFAVSDLYSGLFYSIQFLYPFDERRVYENGVFVVNEGQGYMLKKKVYKWDVDTEALEKLPITAYYNAFGKWQRSDISLPTQQIK